MDLSYNQLKKACFGYFEEEYEMMFSEGQVSLVGNLSLPALNGRWFESLRVRCYRIVSLRERVELEPLGKSPVRAEMSSVEILLVEGISGMRNYSIYVSP